MFSEDMNCELSCSYARHVPHTCSGIQSRRLSKGGDSDINRQGVKSTTREYSGGWWGGCEMLLVVDGNQIYMHWALRLNVVISVLHIYLDFHDF